MSIGITLGRAVGRIAATSVHAGAVTLSATGRFGQDVVIGTTTGYVEHSTRLAALRAHATAERPASIAIVMKQSAKRTKAAA